MKHGVQRDIRLIFSALLHDVGKIGVPNINREGKLTDSEIGKGMGTQFDPEYAKIMLKMIDADKVFKMCEHND